MFQFLQMDAAVTGALIGIGTMACVAVTIVFYDKSHSCLVRWKQQRQPLLSVQTQNPIVILRKHFRMKQLFQKK